MREEQEEDDLMPLNPSPSDLYPNMLYHDDHEEVQIEHQHNRTNTSGTFVEHRAVPSRSGQNADLYGDMDIVNGNRSYDKPYENVEDKVPTKESPGQPLLDPQSEGRCCSCSIL